MKERQFAYKITSGSPDLVCTQLEFEEHTMLNLLKDIKQSHHQGLFWIHKQLENHEPEPLCIIDCLHQRIYYHYSGEVEDLNDTIQKLTK